MLVHLSNDIDAIETRIFRDYEKISFKSFSGSKPISPTCVKPYKVTPTSSHV